MQRRGVAAIGLVSIMALLAGCSAGGSQSDAIGAPGNSTNSEAPNNSKGTVDSSIFDHVPADGVKSKDGLVTKDYTTGFLPGDPYRGMDRRFDYHASDIFQNECMAKSGMATHPVRTFDWNDPANSLFSFESIDPALTVERAQKYGYHDAPASHYEQQYDAAMVEYYRLFEDEAWLDAYDQCFSEMKTQEPFVSFDLQDMPSYVEGVDELPEIRAAAEQWRECMKDLGIPDLPEFPGVADSLYKEFSLGPAGSDGVASEKEIEIAVQDAKCRESSQYDRLLYDAHWVSQENLIEKNSAEYKARLEHINTLTQAYKEYIENHNS